MTARLRRITSDWEQIKKDFSGHKYIIVTPVGEEPYEKYNITYFVNGIYLLPDGRIVPLGRHEVEITLHADYPRYKPICKIMTPIWHPNFRDGQICIGDIWGAGESLSDIIVNIGDMIQYKSWNSFSPLSSEAAQWAMENKHLFPIGTIDLYKEDYTAATQPVEIELFDADTQESGADEPAPVVESTPVADEPVAAPFTAPVSTPPAPAYIPPANDFDIFAEELDGITFTPSAQRMQSVSYAGTAKGSRINFKTILVKGILWALLGAIIGFGLQEALDGPTSSGQVLHWMGYDEVGDYMEKYESIGENPTTADINELNELWSRITLSETELISVFKISARLSSAMFSALIALGLGLFLGIGEGVFYGSKEKAVKYALMGAGISIALGFISGYIAQALYSNMMAEEAATTAAASFIRGIGWSIMGLGVGLAVGLIKPNGRRILFCSLGGLGGGFIGGFLFNYVVNSLRLGEYDTGTMGRAVAIVIMGLLIGLGIGLLEQAAKQAWLKVVRGEFEGKEYLVFAGTTSIGNNGKNTIVLFKDKLVGPNHCDIVLEGGRYVLVDKGTPMGTTVNGMRVDRHTLRKGDAIAVGNSVLIFNTR